VDKFKGIKLEWGMLEGGKASEGKMGECKTGSERKHKIELRMREVDKGGDSLINKGGTAKFTKARLGSLRWVRLAHR